MYRHYTRELEHQRSVKAVIAPRCILILTMGRSGSSAVAGMLHHLGVWMGDDFTPTDRNNRYGTFENKEFYLKTKQVMEGIYEPIAFHSMIPDKHLWGFKTPDMLHIFHQAKRYLGDLRVVVVKRNRTDTIDSAMRAYPDLGQIRAIGWHDSHKKMLDEQTARYKGPLLNVWWEQVRDEPFLMARAMADFVTMGLDYIIPAVNIRKAAEHVRR